MRDLGAVRDPAAVRAGIPERDLGIVLRQGELATVGELVGALEIRIESDDPWLRVLPPRRPPDVVRVAFGEVRAACHGSADLEQLRVRVRAAAGDLWTTTIVAPEDPRDWVRVQLRVAD